MADRVRTDEPIAAQAFEALADAYARDAPTKPHNAYYERPATLSLLPDVRNRRVLDAGCGPGLYAEWLLDHGAEVVGIDVSPRMVALARERLGERATVIQADLGAPLPFLDDASFEVVLAPLVVDYVRDWRALFWEFHRILRPAGCVVFSIEHPFSDFTQRRLRQYFETEVIESAWRSLGRRSWCGPTGDRSARR